MASKKPTSTQIGSICAWSMLSKNVICVCGAKRHFFKNTEKMTFSILDVYPPKIDRMRKIIWPPESSHQGASFEARFAHDSLSKTYSFSWNTEKMFSSISSVYPSKIDPFWEFAAPPESSRPCASFCFLIYLSHPLKSCICLETTSKKHKI